MIVPVFAAWEPRPRVAIGDLRDRRYGEPKS